MKRARKEKSVAEKSEEDGRFYPTTSLKKKDFESGEIPLVEWEPKAYYSWSTGKSIGRFLAELKQCKIVAIRCDSCGRVMLPPRIFCEQCFSEAKDWVYVKETGKVNTFVISRIAMDMSPLKEPKIAAVIDIDGSDGGFLHMLGEVKPEDVRIGMNVKAVWKHDWERKGDITDIKYFKPLK